MAEDPQRSEPTVQPPRTAVEPGTAEMSTVDPAAVAHSAVGQEGPKRTRWIAAAVGVLLIALIAVLAVGSDDRLNPPNEVLGRRVPDVSGPTLAGGTYDIDNGRGQWVIVNFFATWCPGCINEHPELIAFQQWAKSSGKAEIVAVVFNDPAERVEAFFDANGGDWPVLDEPGIPIDFQVAQIPETFVVAPSGQVVQHIQGEVDASELIKLIEESS